MPTRYSGHLELAAWAGGLIYLWWIDPTSHNFSVCLLSVAGFKHCPGCGLGTSIAFLFDGDFVASLQTHPLGLLAVGVLGVRIIALTKPMLARLITHLKGYIHAQRNAVAP